MAVWGVQHGQGGDLIATGVYLRSGKLFKYHLLEQGLMADGYRRFPEM